MRMGTRRGWLSAVIGAGCVMAGGATMACGEPPAEKKEILLGMSTVLDGPTGELGRGVRAGVEAALEEANRAGGIQGRMLRLIALDDGYEPTRTAPNMRHLVGEVGVDAIIGNVGTPTAVVAIPIATEARTPFVGAFTGAGVLRKNPPDRYVFNFRASYAEETGAMVDALIRHAAVRPDEIAFFTQRDSYGDAGFSGGVMALRRHGVTNPNAVTHGRYERNTVAVENGVADILAAEPPAKAVIMVGAYRPTAAFVRMLRSTGHSPIFLSVSFVGTEALASELGSDGEGVVITQVVPPPQSDVPIASAHRAALKHLSPEVAPKYLTLEGYAAARMLLAAMGRIEGAVHRESIVSSLDGMGEFDIGLGAPLKLSPQERQACHRVWATVIRAGEVVPLEWSELKTHGAEAAAGENAEGGR